MDAKIIILSGKSTGGQAIGCTGAQCYVAIEDVSAKDEAGYPVRIYTGEPQDDPKVARTEADDRKMPGHGSAPGRVAQPGTSTTAK